MLGRRWSSFGLMFLGLGLLPAPAAGQTTTRISVDSAGAEANLGGQCPVISADGRYVAYHSSSTNLVPGDTNGVQDVFIFDRLTGQTTRASVNPAGVQGDRYSLNPAISADGRYVAYEGDSSNLVPGDTNLVPDCFVLDRQTGITRRVSVDSFGLQGNAISSGVSISADGRHVAFTSEASNLVPGDVNACLDVFVHDCVTGLTSRVSVDSAGAQGNLRSVAPSLSEDGRFVAFDSLASNLAPGDTNGVSDAFVHDLQTGQTSRVSVDSNGQQGGAESFWPSISAAGRFVAFTSLASNLVSGDANGQHDVFLHDRQTGETTCVSVSSGGELGNHYSRLSAISADGNLVVFFSRATNLVAWDVNGFDDVFVHDRQTGRTSRASVNNSGGQGSNASFTSTRSGKISADGRFVTFESHTTNFDHHDSNLVADVFLRDRGAPNLARTGACPGAITLTISNATGGGNVAIACGSAGRRVRMAAPCAGLLLEISAPARSVVRAASASGTVILQVNAPAGACGRSMQAVDLTTCAASNVIVL